MAQNNVTVQQEGLPGPGECCRTIFEADVCSWALASQLATPKSRKRSPLQNPPKDQEFKIKPSHLFSWLILLTIYMETVWGTVSCCEFAVFPITKTVTRLFAGKANLTFS